MTSGPVVPVPADLELEDRLAGPVTFRMAGWLAAAAAGLALLGLAGDRRWAAGPGLLLIAAGLLGALWRPGGRPAPAWIGPWWSYRRRLRDARDGGQAVVSDAPAVEPEPEPPPPEHGARPGGGGGWSLTAVRVVPAVLLLATVVVTVVVAVTALGRPAWWPGSSPRIEGGPAAPTPPAAPSDPGAATSPPGPAVPAPVPAPAPPQSARHPAGPLDDGEPLVLIPVDPLWPWFSERHGLGTPCGC